MAIYLFIIANSHVKEQVISRVCSTITSLTQWYTMVHNTHNTHRCAMDRKIRKLCPFPRRKSISFPGKTTAVARKSIRRLLKSHLYQKQNRHPDDDEGLANFLLPANVMKQLLRFVFYSFLGLFLCDNFIPE